MCIMWHASNLLKSEILLLTFEYTQEIITAFMYNYNFHYICFIASLIIATNK